MAIGLNILKSSKIAKRRTVKKQRQLLQKVDFFRWKLKKYGEASDTYFQERKYEMMEFCDKNIEAYEVALRKAKRALLVVDAELKALS